MNKKRLIFVMTFLLVFATSAYANKQIGIVNLKVEDISYQIDVDHITLEKMISPILKISFDDPPAWATHPDPSQIHEPDEYKVFVRNLTTKNNKELTFPKGSPEYSSKKIDIHQNIDLLSGSLYETEVMPRHYHQNGAVLEPAPYISDKMYVYALTELETSCKAGSDNVEVAFQDLMVQNVDAQGGNKEIQYKIVYASGIYDKKSDVENNQLGELVVSKKSDGVTTYVDPDTGRAMILATLEDGIAPGQTYSVFVEPIIKTYQNVPVKKGLSTHIDVVNTEIELKLEEEGDYIRLLWEIPAGYQIVGDPDGAKLLEVKVMEIEDGNSRPLAIFKNTNGAIGYYKLIKPQKYGMAYQLLVKYNTSDGYTASNIVYYNPGEIDIIPSRPYIPQLLSKNAFKALLDLNDLAKLKEELGEKYFVKDYKIQGVPAEVYDGRDVFRIDKKTGGVNIVWGAFYRKDVNELSPTYNQYIYDNNVEYDIFVTDRYENLDYVKPVMEKIKIVADTSEDAITVSDGQDNQTIIGYKKLLTKYIDASRNEKDITPGRIYYIKILPRKGEKAGNPATTAFYYGYNGDSFTPPSMAKPPFELKETDTTSITVSFRNKWSEVIGKMKDGSELPDEIKALKEWQSKLYIYKNEDDKTVVSVKGVNEPYEIYKGAKKVLQFKKALLTPYPNLDIIEREVTLGKNSNSTNAIIDAKYRFLCIPFAEVEETISSKRLTLTSGEKYDMEDYIKDLAKQLDEGTSIYKYKEIEPSVDGEELIYTENNLTPNTKYLLLLNPYRVLPSGEEVNTYVPNTIVASTVPEGGDLNPDPEVPNLYSTKQSDMSIDLQFRYNTDFRYKIFYSKKDDKSNLKEIEVEAPKNFKSGKYYKVEVTGLFPDTTYYFWLKAYGNGNESAYSNTCEAKTKDVKAPEPPRHLGLAASYDAKKYGFKSSINKDSIVLSWTKNLRDVEPDKNADKNNTGGKATREYKYQIEIADNNKFIGAKVFLSPDKSPSGGEIHEKTVISLKGLIPNKHYFVRGKTIMIITGEDDELTKESGYTQYFKVLTVADENEYDGHIDLEDTILPENDFELTYDKKKKEAKYRFRYDKDGDNLVSERLISRLITNNNKLLVADLSKYKKAENFKVEIPYPVFRAIDKMRVDLKVKTNDGYLLMPYGALSTQVDVHKVSGEVPEVVLKLENVDEKYYKTGLNNYGDAKRFRAILKSKSKNDELDYFAKDLKMGFDKTQYGGDKFVCYLNNGKEKALSTANETDSFACALNETGIVVPYVYPKAASSNSYYYPSTHWSDKFRREIASQFILKLPKNYNPDAMASKKNVINAFYGAINESMEIDLEKNLSRDEIKTLQRAGVLDASGLSDGTMTRADALKVAVSAYEIKNGRQADGDYVDRGYAYGLMVDRSKFRPKNPIKNSELMVILSKFIKEY